MLLKRVITARCMQCNEDALKTERLVGKAVAAMAFVRTAAGVSKAWDGAVSFTGNLVKLDNAGATDWAAGDVLFCLASG